MSAAVHTAVAATTTAPTTKTTTASSRNPSSSFNPRVPNLPHLVQDGRTPRHVLRTRTSSEEALPPPTTAPTLPTAEPDIAQFDTNLHTATRRPSWIKRLSTISNSQPSSRCPSPAPLSPSVSCSNGSMAFSHDGSTAPMIGKRSPSPLPPNKLVKRSSSVRMSHDSATLHSGSLRPSFRRPATSHQRSATLQHHVARLDITAEDPSLDERLQSPKTDSEIEYAHFFTAKITKERTLSKRRASSVNTNGLRRIFPDQKHKATLVLARSVTAGGDEVDEIASDDGDSVFVVSRPGTPMSMAAIIAPKAASKAADPSQTHTRASEDISRPRRSFSITDLLSSATGAKKPRISLGTNGKLSRRSSQRVSSAPVLPTTGKRRNSASHGEARQDLTNPALARHDLQTKAGSHATESGLVHNGPAGGSSESPSSALPVRCVDGKPRLASMPQLEVIASAVPATNQTPPSPTLAQSGVRPSRHSMAPSEHASTLVGSSDNEVRGLGSGDEDDADFQSDTLFDSLRTGATRSTSGGARGPRIETIFDESPPSKVKVTALRDLLPPGAFGDHTSHGVAGHHSIAEEEESITTPVRTVLAERSLQGSPGFSQTANAPLFPTLIPSSPPSMPKPLSLGTLEWDARMGDDDSSRWSPDEGEIEDPWIDAQTASHTATPVSLLRQHPRLFALGAESKPSTPQHLTAEPYGDRDTRSSIFDWSEQPPDKSSGNRTPPRPRTVHGKKDADRRGSRSVGRRAPSGLHARSQSVPVVPDATGKRNTVVTNKFGTWGVGSKGVTEDWNDDFDFSELVEDPTAEDIHDASKTDSGIAMVVPKTIQEQQNNVLANIGLLREWGLLIEELKEHRIRAITLGIVHGAQSGMWEEVDAMIDLADQEAEHEEVPRLSPPSSPGFDEDAFDDVHGNSPSNGRGRRKSGLPDENAKVPGRRKSILPPNEAIFSPHSSPIVPRTEQKPIVTRPRKDSEAKARSVIEALQQRRSTIEPLSDAPPTPSSKKVPFDTATLRRIVPYVNVLTRKVKDAIRDAEGLYSTPEGSPQHDEPSFNKIFQTDSELTTQTKLMTVM